MSSKIKVQVIFFYNDHNTSKAIIEVEPGCSVKKAAKEWCNEHHCEFVEYSIITAKTK